MDEKQMLTLRLSAAELDDSRLQSVTRDLANTLKEQNIGAIGLPEQPSQKGKKGDAVLIGNIILTLIGSGGVAVSLVQVLKAYIERKPSLHFELDRADGKKLSLNAENLGGKQMTEATRMVEQFLKN
jgi:hypothetical protein